MEEWSRFQLLIGDKIEKMKEITVLIVGVGGVGSYAMESLCRSGIGTLIFIDHDVIDRSNINRQLMALQTNIGRSKVEVWEERISKIHPDCHTVGLQLFLTPSNIEELNAYKLDYIIDACDTVTTKLELLKYAQENKIKIISSMGTGNKLDPTKLELTTLNKTQNDPLARVMRKKVKELHLNLKTPVVCSRELPRKVEGTTVGSCSFLPSMAGLYCTSFVINDILKGEVHEKDGTETN